MGYRVRLGLGYRLQQVEEDIGLSVGGAPIARQVKIVRCGRRYTTLSWSSAAVSERVTSTDSTVQICVHVYNYNCAYCSSCK